jgi:hypothetical protein
MASKILQSVFPGFVLIAGHFKCLYSSSGRAAVARMAHNHQVAGSIPALATRVFVCEWHYDKLLENGNSLTDRNRLSKSKKAL